MKRDIDQKIEKKTNLSKVYYLNNYNRVVHTHLTRFKTELTLLLFDWSKKYFYYRILQTTVD